MENKQETPQWILNKKKYQKEKIKRIGFNFSPQNYDLLEYFEKIPGNTRYDKLRLLINKYFDL